MRLATSLSWPLIVVAAMVSIGVPAAQAEPVDGTWENADTFPADPLNNGPYSTTTSNTFVVGEDPNDPDFDSNFAVQEMIFSPFSTMTLTNPGDKVVFTGSVELLGTPNSPLTSGVPRTQFRFGLFQSNASTDETGWVGYYMSNKHGNAGTPSGTLAVKPVGNTSAFLAVAGQTVLNSAQGDGTDASLFNDGTYAMNLTIERNTAGELLLNGSLTGVGLRPDGVTPNLYSHLLSATHTDAATLGTYTFDRLGFLLGNNLATDRASFMDLDVTFMPGVAGLTGDYNEDGKVDAADYVLWRSDPTSYGGDPQGYNDWVANFGAMAGTGSGLAAAVPEPSALLFVAFAVAVLVVMWRPRKAVLQCVRIDT